MRTRPFCSDQSRRWRQVDQPMPFVVEHLAKHKPNRLANSIRIPVTPGNRALLRWIRGKELSLWEAMLPAPQRSPKEEEPG